MVNIRVCTLNGANLPIQFSYKFGIPEPRMTFTKVAGGVLLQHCTDATPDAPRTIEFKVEAGVASEWNSIYTIYNNATPQVVIWTGYEEESFDVVISKLQEDQLRGGLIDFSGELTVLAVNNEINAQCMQQTPTVTQTL